MKKSLLTSGKSNTKTAKNKMDTFYLSLQPTDLNSAKVNLCKFSTKECRTQCLQYAGRQGFSNVVKSRERKTEMFVTQREDFMSQLWEELVVLNEKGNCAVRLNLLSDVDWVQEFAAIGKDLASLQNVQFYDYTKDHKKVMLNVLPNYDFTLSYSGHNWQYCQKVLDAKKANVAVVFKNEVPKMYSGYNVINGDETDERFLEKKGNIIGLKYKTPKGVKYEANKFVIE